MSSFEKRGESRKKEAMTHNAKKAGNP